MLMVMATKRNRLGDTGGSWVFREGNSVWVGLLFVDWWGLASQELRVSFAAGALVAGGRMLAVAVAPN